MSPQPHRHARLPESTLQGIERPPEITVKQVMLVSFVRGEGCCEEDIARQCTAVYRMDGSLVGVIDPRPRTPAKERL